MTEVRPPGGPLHRLTHRVPGVPEHADRPRGHQGRSPRLHGRSPSLNQALNHADGRRPRVLVAWQRRIAALFGRPLP
ncbi:hypothetical protein [Dactylosporangium sp. NPDC048998]|uniref:hypothetical protein n=1 Tax=Dactylosporangium sp. NPDC048998 TaxID=3363976 RepID=UPI003719AFDE